MVNPARAVSGRHLSGLDGLRALAILGVLAYHLGLGWASGGYLGVDLFFVLSGFLITSLLVEEWATLGRIRLGAFWARRARRLLPALFLMLIAVVVYVILDGRIASPAAATPVDLSGLRGDALATLFYVANWHAILAQQSYFAQFSTPSPLQHTWSLAIEEQFYLLWPLAIGALVAWRKQSWRGAMTIVCVIGAVASAVIMGLLYHSGADPSRAYYGTDTRAFDLLVGAALASLAAGRPQPGRRATAVLHVGGPVAAVALGALWVTAGTSSGMPNSFMFHGGFLLASVLAATIIADARLLERGPMGHALSLAPIRWTGTISYGIYLWHWPVFVFLNAPRTGLSGWELDLARLSLTFGIATVSYYALERPVRLWRSFGRPRRLAAMGAVAVTVVVVVAGTSPSVALPASATGSSPVWTGGGLDPELGNAVPGAGGLGHQHFTPSSRTILASRTAPLRVLTFGDSVMQLAEHGIAADLDSTGAVRLIRGARAGWSLGGAGDQAYVAKHIERLRPQIMIGTWSWDATRAEQDPTSYRRALADAIGQWFQAGQGHLLGIVLLQMPPFGPAAATYPTFASNAKDIPAWNAAARAVAQEFPGRVFYFPVGSSLEVHGRYSTWLPSTGSVSASPDEWVRVRTVDNVHLCPAGMTRYAAAIDVDLHELLPLPAPAPQWWDRPLVVNLVRPGRPSNALSCPDDHPPGTS